MDQQDRDNVFNMYVGTNRTGKSSVAQAFANNYRINNPMNTIAGYDPQGRFKHLIDPRFKISAGEKGWWDGTKQREQDGRLPLNKLRNALVVLDDFKGINEASTTNSDFYRLMEFRAEYNIDVVAVCHSPALILEGFMPYISHYYIFFTKGRDQKFEDKIADAEECIAAANIVKAYMKENPDLIQDPEVRRTLYKSNGRHEFPHIIVDTTTGKLIAQNIPEKWLKENWNKYQTDN